MNANDTATTMPATILAATSLTGFGKLNIEFRRLGSVLPSIFSVVSTAIRLFLQEGMADSETRGGTLGSGRFVGRR